MSESMPGVSPVPGHLHTVTPRLVVRDGAAAIDFYVQAFKPRGSRCRSFRGERVTGSDGRWRPARRGGKQDYGGSAIDRWLGGQVLALRLGGSRRADGASLRVGGAGAEWGAYMLASEARLSRGGVRVHLNSPVLWLGYTVLSASVGARRAARIAGMSPAIAPIRIAEAIPPAHPSVGITTAQCLMCA
jgi:hypothetical protein